MDFIMKTLRYRQGNIVKPGILDQEGNILNADSLVSDWDNETLSVENPVSYTHLTLPTTVIV